MKVSELDQEVKDELLQEQKKVAKEKLRVSLNRVQSAEKILHKLQMQHIDLLNKDIDDLESSTRCCND